MLIINGTVHTMDGITIPDGFVQVEGSKIAAVGPIEQCPKQYDGEIYDAKGGHIQPGFIDAHCHLGMFGDGLGIEGDDGNEATDPCTPHLRAIDAINPLDRCFQEARMAGVTTVLTGPGSANPISGQFAAIKTDGTWIDTMIRKAPAAMKLALGENPKLTYHERRETPTTRMATAALLREQFSKALEYMDKLERAGIPVMTLAHPTAYVSSTAKVGAGTVVLPHAVVNTACAVNRGCIINCGAIVDHGCFLEEGVHVCLGAVVKAENRIPRCMKIEAGTVVENRTYPL